MWPINRGVLMCQLLCPSGTYYAEMGPEMMMFCPGGLHAKGYIFCLNLPCGVRLITSNTPYSINRG